jgi:hypothetical protein
MGRTVRLFFLLALLGLSACATLAGDEWQGIPPAEFHFVPVVGLRGKGPGGWKAARLFITLVRKSGASSRSVICGVQVEVPEVNKDQVITDEFAQQAAAKAADTAAERVLSLDLLSAEMCRRFQEEMQRVLALSIAGARVRLPQDFAKQKKPR